MKKIFTLLLILATVSCANAQEIAYIYSVDDNIDFMYWGDSYSNVSISFPAMQVGGAYETEVGISLNSGFTGDVFRTELYGGYSETSGVYCPFSYKYNWEDEFHPANEGEWLCCAVDGIGYGLTIRFAPEEAGDFTAYLILYTDSGYGDFGSIFLSGSATQEPPFIPNYSVVPNQNCGTSYNGAIRLIGVPRVYTYVLYQSNNAIRAFHPVQDADVDTTSVIFDGLEGGITYTVGLVADNGDEITTFDVYVPDGRLFPNIADGEISTVNSTYCTSGNGMVVINYEDGYSYYVFDDSGVEILDPYINLQPGQYWIIKENPLTQCEVDTVVEINQEVTEPTFTVSVIPNTLGGGVDFNGEITFAQENIYFTVTNSTENPVYEGFSSTVGSLAPGLYHVEGVDMITGCRKTLDVVVPNNIIDSEDGQPCSGIPTVTDINGNTYNTVKIGDQCWMRENLRNASGSERIPWPDLLQACPAGWHLPSSDEWNTLGSYMSSQFPSVDFGNGDYWTSNATLPWEDADGNQFTLLVTPAFVQDYSVNTSGNGLACEVHDAANCACRVHSCISVRCLRNDSITASLPTVTTSTVSNIAATTATCGGNITADGGAEVTARGVCWSTSENPTIADAHTNDGTGTGAFTSSITGLTPNTQYYMRAYATNSEGTAYGDQVMFTTTGSSSAVISIGDGTATSYTNPIGTYYNYSITEQLYTAEEIGMAGTISSISFYYMGIAAKDFPIAVYMANVDVADLSTGISLAEAEQVFSGTLSVPATAGWVTINLDSPFAYDGTSNLLIGVNKGYLYYFSGQTWQGTTTSTTMARYTQNDNNGYTTSTVPGSMQANRPNIQLEITAGGGQVCEKPTDITASQVTPNSVTLNWTENGTATEWQISLNGDTNNLITANSNPFTLAGLTPETEYTVRVRANCGGEDGESAWSSTVTFTPTNTFTHTVNEGTATNNSVPIYGGWCDNITKSQFILPAEDLAPMQGRTIHKLTFYSSNSYSNWGDAAFEVYMTETSATTLSDLADYASMEKVMNAGTLSVTGHKMEVTLDVPYQYQGDNLMIGFLQTVSGTYSFVNWYGVQATSGASWGGYGTSIGAQSFLPKTTFDCVHGEESVCIEPTSLSVEYIGGTEATVSWTENGAATEWQICLNGDTNNLITANSNPFTLTDLTPGTTYTAKMRANCGGEAGSSAWTNSVSFTTDFCMPESKCELTIVLNDSYGDGWNGGKLKVVDALTEIVLGSYTLSGGSTATYTLAVCDGRDLNFVYTQGNWPTENGWLITDINQEVVAEHEGCNSGCTVASGVVANYTVSCAVISCRRPTQLIASNVGSTSVDLSWTENGTATEWQISLNGDTNNLITANSNPFTLTGLTPETAYTVKVRANCGSDGYSKWCAPMTFTTASCPAPVTIDTAVCASELPLTWNGHSFTEFGSHTMVLQTAYGCDSTVILTVKEPTSILLSDDFNDGVIDQEKWTYTGNAVVEEDGQLKLYQNVTDQDVHLRSVDLNVPANGKVTMDRKFMVHRSNNYFSGSSLFYLNGGTDYVGLQYNYDTYAEWYGTYLVYNFNGNGDRFRLCDATFDSWITEHVELDFTAGSLSYYLDTLVATVSIPGLSDQTVDYFNVFFNPYGWWTGHQHFIDYVDIYGGMGVVRTSAVSDVTYTSATCGGEVAPNECNAYTAAGVCWSTSHNPTLADAHTTDGTGAGSFTSELTNLAEGTTYYVRAYAINSTDTVYGQEVSFSTMNSDTFHSLLDGLVAYYPLDDDDLTDHTGNGNNGTNFGTTSTADRFCREGKARNFAGIDNSQYIEVPNSSTLQFNDAATVSLWFCMNGRRGMDWWGNAAETTVNAHILFAKNYDQNGKMFARVTVQDNGDFTLGAHISNTWAEGTMDNLQIGQWVMATFVFTDTYVETYYNGRLLARSEGSNSFETSNGNNLYFGRLSSYWYPLNGKMDDIRVFNRALSPEEVAQLYYLDIVPSDSLLVLMPLDGDVTDYSGNEFQPVLHGNVTPTTGHNGTDSTAYRFPGEVSSWIEIPHNDRLNLCGSFTVSAWYNRDEGWQYGNLVSKGRDVTNGWALNTSSTHTNGYMSGGTDASAQITPSDGNWHMTTGVYDLATSTLRYYLDGELQDEQSNVSAALSTENPVAIGRHLFSAGDLSSYPYPFKGSIDDIVIYNRPLSEEEVQMLYAYNPHAVNCLPEDTGCHRNYFIEDSICASALPYIWNDKTYTASGDYTQTFASVGNCDSVVTLHLTVYPSPSVSISGNTPICDGGSTSIAAVVSGDLGNYSYQWYKNGNVLSGENSEVLNIDNLTYGSNEIYMVEVYQDGMNCSGNASSPINALVTVVPTYAVSISGYNSVCVGETLNLEAVVSGVLAGDAPTYQWYEVNVQGNLIPVSGANVPIYSTSELLPDSIYEYFVMVTSSIAECSSTSAGVFVSIVTPPTITITGTADINYGQSTTLTASGADRYEWSTDGNSIGNNAAVTVSPEATTTYFVTGYRERSSLMANGASSSPELFCSATDSITVTVYYLPTVTTDPVSDIATFSATCGGNVTSDGGANVTGRGVCWSTSQDPTIADTHTTDGTGMGAFISTLSNLEPVTTYYVRAYATNRVGTAYGQEVTFTTPPCDPISNEFSAAICETALPYIWNDSTYTETGDYMQTFTTAQHCDSVVTLHLTVNQNPVVTISGNTPICDGGSTSISAVVTGGLGNNSYQWYKNGNLLSGENNEVLNIDNLAYGSNDTYKVEVYQESTGCSGNASSPINSLVTVVPTYTVAITGYNKVCVGDTLSLETVVSGVLAGDAPTYQWYETVDGNPIAVTGASTPTYSNSELVPNNVHEYFVTVTSSIAECSFSSDPVLASIVTPPTITISGTANINYGESTTLTASGADRYEWSTGGNSIGNNAAVTVSPEETTIYSVTGYHERVNLMANGASSSPELFCEATKSITVRVYYLPTVTTKTVSGIGSFTANCGGNVTSSGGATVTSRGVCWSTSHNPTIAGAHTTDGTGSGAFTSTLTDLEPNTTYYVRAYATNRVGTAYGQERSFTTSIYCYPISSEFRVAVCASELPYIWNDSAYTETGDYTQTFTNANNCDSVVTLHFTVLPSTVGEFTAMTPINRYVSSYPIRFTWAAVENATDYDLYVWPEGESQPQEPTASHLHGTYCVVSELSNHNVYQWFMKAYNTCDTSLSIIHQFTLNVAPSLTVTAGNPVNFGEVPFNSVRSVYFQVNGTALDSSITYQLTGADATSFSLDSTDNWDNLSGGRMQLTFHPTVPQNEYTAQMTFQSDTLVETFTIKGYLSDFFTFTTYVDSNVYAMDSEIPIHGQVRNLLNEPVEGLEVEVYVNVSGYVRTLPAISDANGQFTVTFTPQHSEAGYYTVGSRRAGSNNAEVHDEFNIPGMMLASSDWILWETTIDQADTGTIAVRNRSQIPITNIQVTPLSLPNGCTVQFAPLSLAGLATGDLQYVVSGSEVSTGNNYEEVRLNAVSDEGAAMSFIAWYYCLPQRADLDIIPTSLVTTMTRGKSKVVDFMIYNNGAGSTGNIYVSLPDVPWMSVVGNDTLPSLAAHDSAYISIRLSADSTTDLVRYTGNFAINCERGEGMNIPYDITAISDSTGTLVVDVTDEYTLDDGHGPHLAGANVTVIGFYSLETVSTGVTDENGLFVADNLPEGWYKLIVRADRHSEYQNYLYITAGDTNRQDIFIQFQALTFTFDVVPTEIEDVNTFVLNVEFETHVPKPVITMDADRALTLLDDCETGEFNMIATNHGLVAAMDVSVIVPQSDYFVFTPLVSHLDSLPALTSYTIPVVYQRKDCAELGHLTLEFEGQTQDYYDGVTCEKNMLNLVYYYICRGTHWETVISRYLEYNAQQEACGGDPRPYNVGPGPGPGPDIVVNPNWHINYPNSIPSWSGGGSGGGNVNVGPHTHPIPNEIVICDPNLTPCQNALNGFLGCVPILSVSINSEADGIYEPDFIHVNVGGTIGNITIEGVKAALNYFGFGIISNIIDLGENAGCLSDLKNNIQNIKTCVQSWTNPYTASEIKERDIRTIYSILMFLTRPSGYLIDYQANPYLYNVILPKIQSLSSTSDGQRSVAFYEGQITDAGRAEILNACLEIDDGPDVEDFVNAVVDRWNHSIEAWNSGYFTSADAPAGYDTNFIQVDTNVIREFYELNEEAVSQGYANIFERFAESVTALQSAIEDYQNNQTPSSLCATVTVQFTQRMTMTREAFEGTLTINNGHESNPMQDIDIDFVIRDENGVDCTNLFQINFLSYNNMTGTNGSASLDAQNTGSIVVHFIPTKQAAPEIAKVYSFGGSFSFIDPFTGESMTYNLYPVDLWVHPSPDLYVNYFMQRDILGDDPLTEDRVEPIVPAELGVIIHNRGAGIAKNVILETAEPQIIDNEKGLAIDFAMYGAAFNGNERQLGLMAIPFGNIEPNHTGVGEWWFTSTLLGHFVSYEAHVIHNNSFGNPDLSLVSSLDIHPLIHTVYAYGNLDDGINDFLVDDVDDYRHYPDSLYFSNGSRTGVAIADSIGFDHYVTPEDTIVQLTLDPSRIGWNYEQTWDPGRGQYKLISCTRNSDQQVIPLSNVWQTFVTLPVGADPVYENRLHIVDTLSNDLPTTYTLVFSLHDLVLAVDTIMNVPDSIITTPLSEVKVKFNKPIVDSTFNYLDMSLKCNNGENLLDENLNVERMDSVTYKLHLGDYTQQSGLYVLTVQTIDITDKGGYPGYYAEQAQWVQMLSQYVELHDTVCDGTDYTFHGDYLTASGWYFDTLRNESNTNDSVVYLLHLIVNHSTTSDTIANVCGSFDWYEHVGITQSGDYIHTFTSIHGCDSVVTLHLTVNFCDTSEVVVTITGHNSTDDYDGTEHSVSGYEVEISNPLYTEADFIFSGTAEAARTDAGTTNMGLAVEQFANTNSNFTNVTFIVTDGYQTINPIDATVTITGHNNTVDYDGVEHSVIGYDVEISDSLYTEADFTFSGTAEASRTDAGTTNMGLAVEQFANTNSNFANVTFNVTDGYQTINPIDVTVTIAGHHNTTNYDGAAYTVTGYDVTISNPLYTEADFTFSGDSIATRTEEGTTYMGLAEDQFTNINPNFDTVTFNVTDGYQTIVPADVVVVTITGHHNAAMYDGEEHNVSGYDVEISDSLYTEADFTFNGTATAGRTNAGTTNMGLAAEQFVNTSTNFATVVFDVTDGYQTITRRTVTLTSASDSHVYNGDWLTNQNVTVEGDGFVTGEGAAYEFTGRQLVPGTSDNTFTYTLNEGTLAENYIINTSFGTLTVENRPEDNRYPIEMVSNTIPVFIDHPIFYDGLEHSIEDFVTHTFTENGHTYTVSGLTASSGSHIFAGTYENVIEGDAVVTDEYGNDVTAQFDVHYTPGTLTITPKPITFTIVNEEVASKVYDGTPLTVSFDQLHWEGLAETDTLIAGTITTDGSEVGDYSIYEGNMFYTESTGWAIKSGFKIKHASGVLVLASYKPTFTLMLKIKPIDCHGVTYQGHPYDAVQIGSQCWLAENLRNTTDADGHPIETYRAVNDDPANVDKYGYLYSWYSAVGVEEDNDAVMPVTLPDGSGGTYVRGICPTGWAVPSQEDVNKLRAAIEDNVNVLKSVDPQYWIPGAAGVTPNTEFNAKAAGLYNSSTERFEKALLFAYFWESDSQLNISDVISAVIGYYCSNVMEEVSPKSDLRPVRCVRKVAH